MGSNTLLTIEDGSQIKDTDFNQLKEALSGDFLPRTKSGVIVDLISSIGRSSARWANGHFKQLSFGSGINLKDVSGNLSVEINDISVGTIDTGIPLTMLKDASVPNTAYPSTSGQDAENYDEEFNSNTQQWNTVTSSTFAVTSSGRYYMVGLKPTDSQIGRIEHRKSGSSSTGQVSCRIRRSPGSVIICNFNYDLDQTTAVTADSYKLPPFLMFLDPNLTTAGNGFSYLLEVSSQNLSLFPQIRNLKFFVIEL